MTTAWNSDDFGGAPDATPAKDRGMWERFKDAYLSSALHSPLGAEGVSRLELKRRGYSDDQINAVEKRLSGQYAAKQNADPAFRGHGFDLLAPSNIGRAAVDLAGNLLGGADPSYALAPGASIPARIAAQGAINAGMDAASQGLEVHRGVREKFDPAEVALNAAAGAVFQGGGEALSKYRTGRMINSGASHPIFSDLESTVLGLENGGSLDHPKVSPKGAKGPYQVMDATARDPGFGIRPWDGKTEADRARVGRQYLAVMTHRYGGDPAKILAAYNAGPGTVDHAIKNHGANWFDYLPNETKDYVSNGVTKLGRAANDSIDLQRGFPRPSSITLAQNELPSALEQRTVNDALSPAEEAAHEDIMHQADDSHDNVSYFPEERIANRDRVGPVDPDAEISLPADVANFRSIRYQKHMAEVRDRLKSHDDEYLSNLQNQHDNMLDILDEHLEGRPSLTPDQLAEARNAWEEMSARHQKSKLPPLGAGLVNSVLRRFDDFDAEIKKAEGLAEKPAPVDNYHEKFTPNIDEPRTPANANKAPTFVEKAKNFAKELLNDENGSYRDSGFDREDTSGTYESLSPEGKLIKAVREAKPLSATQRSMYRQARAERAGRIDRIQQEGKGLAGYHEQLGQLKGELPKADFESFAKHFTDDDVSHLLNKINGSKTLLPLEKVKAQTALMKLLGSEGAKIPTAGDIKLLSQVYSEDFITALLDNRDFMTKFWHGVGSTLNIPRALMASMDLSAPFRQGIFFIGKKEYWKSFGHMFKLFGSEQASKALMENIRSRPSWGLMKRAGLAITDPHSHYLADREEAFMTDYSEKIPIVGLGVKASNRAYSGFLNKLRADVFDDLIRKYEDQGINVATDTKKLREIASFINAATGRGSLGKWGNPAAPALGTVFFSPRLIASRVQMLSPTNYLRRDPILRKEAWKAMFAYGSMALTVAGLAKFGLGWDVETNPTSADFMKPKVGNTRFDFMGGGQQYIRFAAEMITGEAKNANGDTKDLTSGDFGQDTRKDVAVRFLGNKLSPVASFVWDWMGGKDAVGNKFDITKHDLDLGDNSILKNPVVSRLVPLMMQDVTDAYHEWGAKGLAVAVPSTFGVGVQTYQPRQSSKADDFASEFKKDFASDFANEFSSKDFQ